MLAGFLLLTGVLALIWTPIAPRHLFDFDSANFALALGEFNPAIHQPQPPGYPLYVGLSRLIHFFVPEPVRVFLIAGILGAAAAVLMLGMLASMMLGRNAGVCAALLLMTNPVLWQAGMIDQVRVYLAVISTAVALLVWPEWERPPQHRRFVWACLILGILAGFRPETLLSLTPLLIVTGIRARMNLRYWTAGALALCLGIAPWLLALIASMGGFDSFSAVMQNYAHDQAGGTSIVLGAQLTGVLKMFDGALWWLSLGLAAWMPALLLLALTKRFGSAKSSPWLKAWPRIAFLLAWFLPQFLFCVIVHIAAAGHALGFLPVLCLAGGWTLSRLGTIVDWKLTVVCAALAMALNVRFFLHPYSQSTTEAGYKTVHYVSGMIDASINQINAFSGQPGTFLIDYDGWVAWRILEYYYPSVPVVHLPDPGANPAEPVWLFLKKHLERSFPADQEVELPSCGTYLWLVTDDRSRRDLLAVPEAQDEKYFVMTPAQPGMHFQLGRYRLKTSTQPCPAVTAH